MVDPAGQGTEYDDGAGQGSAVVVPPRPSVPLWRAVAGAVVGGVVAALLGTALHAQVWYPFGIGVAAGALGAVVLAGSVALYVSLWARNVMMAALTGVAAYVIVGVIATGSLGSLIVTGTTDGAVPVVGVAGYVWVIGLAAVTVVAVAVSWWVLKRSTATRRPD